MKKNYKAKLLGAIAALGLAVASTVGSTYAWFSMNSKVDVTGMQVKTKVSSNLLVSPDVITATARKAENTFVASLEQTSKTFLEPVSTINGKDFFYTVEAKADGSKNGDNNYETYDPSDLSDFTEAYGITSDDLDDGETDYVAGGYADYVFQLKAVNAENDAREINVTKLELVYSDASYANSLSKAWRVALFVETIANESSTYAGATTLVGIYTPSGAAYFDNTAVSAVNAKDTPSPISSANTYIASVAANTTAYYKVTLRLWLEGEDTTCNNDTFAKLSNAWNLNVELKLGDTDADTTGLQQDGVANLDVRVAD